MPANIQPWLIMAAVAVVILYLKGYIKVPGFLSGGTSTAPVADPVPTGGTNQSESHKFAVLLAQAAVRDSHQLIAERMATDVHAKMMEGLTSPFSEGGTPAAPPVSPATK